MSEELIHQFTAASIVFALAIWWYFIFNKARNNKLSLRRLVLLIIVIGALSRIIYAAFTPDFYAPDEEAHFNYIKYLAVHNSLPIQQHGAIWHGQEYEYYQPPLYYLASAIVAFPFVKAGLNDSVLLLIMRLLNIVFWLISLILALKILKEVKIRNHLMILTVVALFTLVPTFTGNTATVNNDVLPILIGHLFLLTCLKISSWKTALFAGVLLGLAMLSKLTAVVFLVYIVAMLLYKKYDGKISAKEAIITSAIIAFVAFLCWLPWGLRNLELYHEFTATNFGNPAKEGSFFEKFKGAYIYSLESFWSVSGRYNNIYFAKWAGKLITLTAFGGLLLYLLKNRQKITKVLNYDKRKKKHFIWAGVAAFIANYLLVLKFGVDFGQGQGRFLYPMLLPLSLMFGYGFIYFRKLPYLNLFFTGILLIFNVSYITYSLLSFISLAQSQ